MILVKKSRFTPDLRQKSLSRKLSRVTNFRFWIFLIPNMVVNFDERIGDGTLSKIKWQLLTSCHILRIRPIFVLGRPGFPVLEN